MNNGAYMSQTPDAVGPKVEELLRHDLESQTTLPYEIEAAGAGKLSATGFLSDAVISIIGGRETLLFTVCFNLTQPRAFSVRVPIDRQGVGSHIGALLFTAPLSKPVAAEVSLGDPKMFGSSKFAGDAATAEKLNANSDLIKRLNKFSRLEAQALKLKAPRMVKVVPGETGAVFVALTLPRSYAMGLKVSLEAKEFVELAGLVEASL